jgi:murein L,D-transpeptidase YcbB/YkuD
LGAGGIAAWNFMRAPSYQATLTAVALLIGTGTLARAGDGDSFFADLDKTPTNVVAEPNKSPVPLAAPATERASPTASRRDKTSRDKTSMDALFDRSGDAAFADHTSSIATKPEPSVVPSVADQAQIAPVQSTPAQVTPALNPPVIKTAAPAKPVKAKGDLDPEPDEVIIPPSTPSNDPLDKTTSGAATKTGAAKDAAKTESGKSDPIKPDALQSDSAKSDSAKTDANKTDATKADVAHVEPLPVLNAAIKAALDKRDATELKGGRIGERRKERAAIAFFYAAHGFAPTWSEGGKASAAVEPVLARLARAGDDALTIGTPPSALAVDGTPEAIAQADIALTETVVSYARQATGSRVDPSEISPLIGSKPTLADPAEVLEKLMAAGADAGDTLAALNPSNPRYASLRDKLATMKTEHEAATPSAVPDGPTLKIGMHDPRVPLLRTRFGIAALDGDETAYDSDLSDAVALFQKDHGLAPSGLLTKRTVAAMSGGRPVRLQGTIIANMEMWRWMPRDLGADRIEVNVPDFVVTVFHDNVEMSQNRVVVGKMDTPTPLFSNTMKYLIVNPYWNVPQSIIKNEMLPKGGGSLSYLNGRGYSVSSHNGMPVVKQLPGDKNALGRIKFLFPNDYSVYLHDTPSKSFFASTKRAFSHGCVRVDKPFAFAESVLNDGRADGRKAWSQERLEDMIGDKERYVNLPTPLPIHIEYFTASVEPGGDTVKTRDDIYGYANAVAAALGQETASLPVAGRVKPKPLVAERVRRRPAIAETASAAPPPPASRSFWDVFDPR